MPRVGLFGGTFDPVHRGHLGVAAAAARELDLSPIVFLPAWVSPHKQDSPPTAAVDRLHLVERAIASHARFVVSPWEIRQERACPTVETVDAFRRRFPGWSFTLILGEDSWDNLPTWRDPERLATLVDFAVYRRAGSAHSGSNPLAARVHWLAAPPIDVTATSLRGRLAQGEWPQEIPAPVADAIRQRGLYRNQGSDS